MEKYELDSKLTVIYNYVNELDASRLDEFTKDCTLVLSGDPKSYIEDGNIIGGINYPDLNMGEKQSHRIAIFSDEFKNPLLDVMEIFSNLNIQIKRIKTVRRDDGMSYTLSEVDGEIPEIDFSELPGVKKARIIS